MYTKILVPLDGSDLSAGILPHVVELARKFGSQVVVLQAVTPMTQILAQTAPTGLSSTSIAPDLSVELAEGQQTAEMEAAREDLAGAAAALTAAGINVEQEIVPDSPAQAILAYAREHGADLIAMSTHGRGGLDRLVFGSVADEVIRNSTAPVLLIRPKQSS